MATRHTRTTTNVLRLLALVACACGDDAASHGSTSGGTDTEGTGASETTSASSSTSFSESSSTGGAIVCPDEELEGTLPMNVRGNTLGRSDDFAGSCSEGAPAPDVSFSWTAPEDGVFTFDTLGTSFDTVLFVLDGACAGEELACNDDLDPARQVRQSAVAVDLEAGQTVTIVVDGFSADHVGEVELHINGGNATCPDDTLDRVPAHVIGSTETAIAASSSTCGGAFASERSYSLVADIAGTYTFDTFGSSFDTVLYVLDGGCDGTTLACNDDAESSSASGALVDLHEGQTVTVIVDGAPGHRGDFDLAVGRLGGACPDDDLGVELPVSVSASTVGAENTTGSSCGGWFAPDLTYAWQAPLDGLYRFDTVGSDFDTVLGIRDGSCDGAELACNDDRRLDDESSEVTLVLLAGQAVTVAVGGKGRTTGSAALHIHELACPEIDMGSALPHTQMGTLGGGSDKLNGSCGGVDAPDRALGWTAPADGTYVFDTFGSAFDTVLYALDGGCAGAELACNDDVGGMVQSRLVLVLTEGQTVVLVVEGYAGATGSYVINVTTDG